MSPKPMPLEVRRAAFGQHGDRQSRGVGRNKGAWSSCGVDSFKKLFLDGGVFGNRFDHPVAVFDAREIFIE